MMKAPLHLLLAAGLLMPLSPQAQTRPDAPAALALAEGERVNTMRVDGELRVGPDGELQHYRLTTPLDAQLQAVLQQHIGQWRFSPVRDDAGHPAVASGKMRLTLVARESEGPGNYLVSVENVRFFDAEDDLKKASDSAITVLRPPRVQYPSMLQDAGVSGRALAQVLIAPDGKVEDVVVVQSAMFNVKGSTRRIEWARQQMEEAVIQGISQSRFAFAPDADISDIGRRQGMMVVEFVMHGHAGESARRPGVWRMELRSPYRVPLWVADEKLQRFGVSDIDSDEGFVSLAPGRLQLLRTEQ